MLEIISRSVRICGGGGGYIYIGIYFEAVGGGLWGVVRDRVASPPKWGRNYLQFIEGNHNAYELYF